MMMRSSRGFNNSAQVFPVLAAQALDGARRVVPFPGVLASESAGELCQSVEISGVTSRNRPPLNHDPGSRLICVTSREGRGQMWARQAFADKWS
jgi:hypothetical protein